MKLGRVILRPERTRRDLLSIEPGDKEKILAASRKVDKLIVEYYRAKLGPKTQGREQGDNFFRSRAGSRAGK